jgi:hypothetical protein
MDVRLSCRGFLTSFVPNCNPSKLREVQIIPFCVWRSLSFVYPLLGKKSESSDSLNIWVPDQLHSYRKLERKPEKSPSKMPTLSILFDPATGHSIVMVHHSNEQFLSINLFSFRLFRKSPLTRIRRLMVLILVLGTGIKCWWWDTGTKTIRSIFSSGERMNELN